MQIAAGEFKTHCLGLMDQVYEGHRSFIITKRGKPVAKLVPVDDVVEKPIFGFMKGHANIMGDIVESTGEKWEADA